MKPPNVLTLEILLQIHYKDDFVLKDNAAHKKALKWLNYHDLVCDPVEGEPLEVTLCGWEYIQGLTAQ